MLIERKHIWKNLKDIKIEMDDDPFDTLENGYKKINLFDFLLNEKALEEL